jgi:hypothetical protein
LTKLFAGYDRKIEERIGYMLEHDYGFLAQFDALLLWQSARIDVEAQMSCHPFVSFYIIFSLAYAFLTIPSAPEMSKSELWTLIYRAGYVARTVDISRLSSFI